MEKGKEKQEKDNRKRDDISCLFNTLPFCAGILEPKEIELPNCPAEAWVGNGKCDDETNIPECEYDGGDCCMDPYVQGFCTICVCYDD